MDILYKLERATVADVLNTLTGKPNYSTVRAQLRVLGKTKVMCGTKSTACVHLCSHGAASQLHDVRLYGHLVETFFEGSAEKVVAALLGGEVSRISQKNWTAYSLIRKRYKGELDHECAPQLRTIARAVNSLAL